MVAIEIGRKVEAPPTRINPGGSLIRSILNRHRQGIVAVYIYLAFLCVAVHIAHQLLHNADYFFTITIVDAPLLFAFVYLVGTFTGAGADIVSAKSGFPAHFSLVPMKTTAIVNSLGLFGVSVVVATWSVVDIFVLRDVGQSVPLLETLPPVIAGMMVLQMLVWMPLGIPYLRIPLALSTVACAVFAIWLEVTSDLSPLLTFVVPGIVFAGALAGSYQGVALTRCGISMPWDRTQRTEGALATSSSGSGLSFKSSFKALLWMEWRTHGRVLPIVVGTLCLLTLFAFFDKGLYPLDPTAKSMSGVGTIRGPLWLLIAETIPFLAAWMAACMTGGNGKSDEKHKDVIVNSFASVRPASASTLIAAKLSVAAISTLLTWAALLPFLILWLLMPANDFGASASMFSLLSKYMSTNMWLCFDLFLITMVLLTWKLQVDNLFFQLTEREWLKYVYWTILPLIYAAPVEALILGWVEPNFLTSLVAVTPVIIWIATGLKCIAAVLVCLSLIRKKVLTPKQLAGAAGIWLIAVVAISGFAVVVIPSGTQLISILVPVSILIVPAVRIGIAPLELHSSRHR